MIVQLESQSNSNRREFIGHLGKTAAATYLARTLLVTTATGSALALGGCNVWDDIEAWVPVGETALNGIVKILAANGFVIPAAGATAIQLALAGLNQLLADVKLYKSITPPPVGALQKVEAAFGVITSNFQAFLSAIDLPQSPLLSTIIAIAQVVISTIAAFQNRMPSGTSIASTSFSIGVHAANGASGGHVQLAVAPKSRSVRKFKKDWNSVLDAGAKAGVKCPPEVYMNLSFWEHL